MSSAAFSVPNHGRPIRRGSKRGRALDTATAAAADAAIRQIVDRRRHRHQFGSSDDEKTGVVGQLSAEIEHVVADSIRQMGLPQWALKVAFITLVAGVLGWAVFLRGAVSHHTVDGVLVFEGRPVADATLTFSRAGDSPDEARVFRTDTSGVFRTEADATLPAGLYTVVVQPPKPAGGKATKKPVIPAMYADAATTPLRVQVSEDLTGLKLLVRRAASNPTAKPNH